MSLKYITIYMYTIFKVHKYIIFIGNMLHLLEMLLGKIVNGIDKCILFISKKVIQLETRTEYLLYLFVYEYFIVLNLFQRGK